MLFDESCDSELWNRDKGRYDTYHIHKVMINVLLFCQMYAVSHHMTFVNILDIYLLKTGHMSQNMMYVK